jgi:hypothetical protein
VQLSERTSPKVARVDALTVRSTTPLLYLPSTAHSCSTSQMSVPFSSEPLQLENTPCPLQPPSTLHESPSALDQFDQFVDDISDIDDSDSDDDLSPVLNAITVSSMTVLFCTVFQTSLILMPSHSSLLDHSNSPKSCQCRKSQDRS